jgi:hypothetical protein
MLEDLPLVVGSTLRVIKGGPQPAAKPKPAPPSLEAISLVEILRGHNKRQNIILLLAYAFFSSYFN